MFSYTYLIPIFVFLLIMAMFFVWIAKRRASCSEQHYPENEQLYVGNLSYQVNNQLLREIFSKYGQLEDIRVIKNTKTGRSKGFAFVTYSNIKDAKKALAANGSEIRGRIMVVRMAKPREK